MKPAWSKILNYLALDLSKRSTGWAAWQPGWDKPVHGSQALGSEYTRDGQVFAKCHQMLSDLRATVCRFDLIAMERPIHPAQLQGSTTIQVIRLASGIAAHVFSFAHAMGLPEPVEYSPDSWRPEWIGRIEDSEAKRKARRARKDGDKRASARDSLKALTVARCQQLGLRPRNDDEADAIGILTYAILSRGETPPWLADEVLRQPLEIDHA